jgi:hypothetical protein
VLHHAKSRYAALHAASCHHPAVEVVQQLAQASDNKANGLQSQARQWHSTWHANCLGHHQAQAGSSSSTPCAWQQLLL